MFTTAYVVDMPGGEPEAALVGIGEPSDESAEIDDRVFYYFESLAEINAEHTDWSPDTWFTVAGIDLPCYVCGEVDDGGNQVVPVEIAPDRFGDPIEIEHLARCADCGRKS
jgi:hypothetical protein